jgi:hypothetical protein
MTLFIFPASASALSCLNPTELVDSYVNEEQYSIALVEAGEIETKGDEHDQSVLVKETYKGLVEETVTFNWNDTWQYLCVGGPAETGTEAVYILSEGQVVQVVSLDSPLYEDLMTALKAEPTGPKPVEPTVTEVDKTLMQQIISLLKQMIGLLGGKPVMIEPEEVAPITPAPGIHDEIIGLSEIEAAAYADTQDVLFRVGSRDGEFLPVTMDLRPGRITAEIEKDRVTGYTVE